MTWAVDDSYGRGLLAGQQITLWSFLCRQPLPPERDGEHLPSMPIDWTHPMGPVLYTVDFYKNNSQVIAAWMGENTLVCRDLSGHVTTPADRIANMLVRMIKDQELESRPNFHWHTHCQDLQESCLEPERFQYMTKGV